MSDERSRSGRNRTKKERKNDLRSKREYLIKLVYQTSGEKRLDLLENET